MKTIKHHILRGLIALVLICVSLPVMFDVFTQKTGVASETLANPNRFSARNLDTLAITANRPIKPGTIIDLTKTQGVGDPRQAARKALSNIQSDNPQSDFDEVDKMLAEIDSVLNEIEEISDDVNKPSKKALSLPNLEPSSRKTGPKTQAAITQSDRITPFDGQADNSDASDNTKLVNTLNASMQDAIRHREEKRNERVPMSDRELAQKLLDRVGIGSTSDNDQLSVLETRTAAAETIVIGKSSVAEASKAPGVAGSLLALAQEHGRDTANLEKQALTQQLRDLQNDIKRQKEPVTATPAPTTLAAAPAALRKVIGEDDQDYVEKINAGDLLLLSMPGEDSLSGTFEINRDGTITLPEVGTVLVSGLTIVEANDVIREELSTVFKNLGRLTVEIKERKLSITVLGFVKIPGQIQLPEDGNVQMAITEAGGLSIGAQLDRMQVRRGDQVFTFNYKDYLNSGDISILPVLKPLDVIFVPASPLTGAVEVPFSADTLAAQGDGGDDGKGIRIFGEVRTPTTMAYKEGLTLIDALMRTGGISIYAAVENIRIVTKQGTDIVNLKQILDKGRLLELPSLAPGTTIYVPKKDKELQIGGNVIYVMGEAAKAGAYEVRGKTKFIDILANAGGPTRYAETRQIRIIRKDTNEIVMVDLPSFTEGKINTLPSLFPGDTVFIPEKADNTQPSWLKVPSERAVQVLGAMKAPGRYEWSDEMSFFDLIAAAGGPSTDADLSRIKILKKTTDGSFNATFFDMAIFIEKGGNIKDLPQIHAGYAIIVPSNDGETAGTQSTIKVLGEVQKPGNVEYAEDLTIIDVLLQTGGVTRDAAVDRIRVLTGGDPVYLNLQDYLDTGDASLLPEIQKGATVFVPRVKEGNVSKTVQTIYVMGEVAKPGGFEIQDETSFIDVIANAGGPTRFADIKAIRVIRADGSVDNVNLPSFTEGRGGILPQIYPGDTVFFPRAADDPNRPSWLKIAPDQAVELFGAVARPDRYEWSDEMTFFDLIAQAGGPLEKADVTRIQIVNRINGRAVTTTFNMKKFIESGGRESDVPKINTGTTVNVPFLVVDGNQAAWLKISPDRAVEVLGAVTNPNRYEWSDEMTFFDLIAHAGGPTRRADLSRVQILVKQNGRTIPTYFDMESFIKHGGHDSDVPKIKGGYIINIPFLADEPTDSKGTWLKQPAENSIYLFGQVGAPGRYAFNNHLTFIDIISAADGPTTSADLRNIRVSHRNRGEAGISNVNLALYFETGDEALLPHVVPGDVIYIPSRERDWLDNPKEQTVRVLGAVGSPGRYRFEDNMTILDLLAEAGGPTGAALQKKIVVINLSETRDQARTFNLVRFAKTGDTNLLPVVRVGDTVYVPDRTQSIWAKLQTGVSSTSSLLTFGLALIALGVGAP